MTTFSMEEKDGRYPIWADVSMFNENGILKPSSYQRLFTSCAERHLAAFAASTDLLLTHDLAWALISTSFKVHKPVTECQTLTMQTWLSQHKGPYFRRDFVFRSENDDIMFCGTSFSILLNVKTRSVFRKKELPFDLTVPFEKFAMEANPTFKTDLPFEDVLTRRVFPGHIDRLGHMNNICYGDLAYDALLPTERSRLCSLKRIDAHFVSEMRLDDTFVLQRAAEGSRILLRGNNLTKGDISFYYVIEF